MYRERDAITKSDCIGIQGTPLNPFVEGNVARREGGNEREQQGVSGRSDTEHCQHQLKERQLHSIKNSIDQSTRNLSGAQTIEADGGIR